MLKGRGSGGRGRGSVQGGVLRGRGSGWRGGVVGGEGGAVGGEGKAVCGEGGAMDREWEGSELHHEAVVDVYSVPLPNLQCRMPRPTPTPSKGLFFLPPWSSRNGSHDRKTPESSLRRSALPLSSPFLSTASLFVLPSLSPSHSSPPPSVCVGPP